MMLYPQLTKDEIIEACNVIGYNDFVNTLSQQYETVLAENGTNLSSGQKQKLNAIRAYISQADIILLDEVTSDLDGVSEIEIKGLIKELSKTKLVLLISHRITSIMDSKRIYILDGGQIVNNGCHEALMEQSKLYQELFIQCQL